MGVTLGFKRVNSPVPPMVCSISPRVSTEAQKRPWIWTWAICEQTMGETGLLTRPFRSVTPIDLAWGFIFYICITVFTLGRVNRL